MIIDQCKDRLRLCKETQGIVNYSHGLSPKVNNSGMHIDLGGKGVKEKEEQEEQEEELLYTIFAQHLFSVLPTMSTELGSSIWIQPFLQHHKGAEVW